MIAKTVASKLYPPIQELVYGVYSEYKKVNFDTDHFSTIATAYLQQFNNDSSINSDAIFAWLVSCKDLPTQFAHKNHGRYFGEPPVTLFYCEHFVLDTYFWINSNTDIHDHAFSGAFKVISGETLQSCYHFNPMKTYPDRLALGEMQLLETRLLRSFNEVVPIIPGDKFIHATTHLEKPTVTLCLRTRIDPKCREQYGYYPTGIRHMNILNYDLPFQMQPVLALRKDSLYSKSIIDYLSRLTATEKLLSLVQILNYTLDYNLVAQLVSTISCDDDIFEQAFLKLIAFYQQQSKYSELQLDSYREQCIYTAIITSCTDRSILQQYLDKLPLQDCSEQLCIALSALIF
jgi:hypothetical protein